MIVRCISLQEVYHLLDMFYVRKMLHQRACQHKTAVAIELMCVYSHDKIRCDGVEAHSCIDNVIRISLSKKKTVYEYSTVRYY